MLLFIAVKLMSKVKSIIVWVAIQLIKINGIKLEEYDQSERLGDQLSHQ